MTDLSPASDPFSGLLLALSRRTATTLEAPGGLLILMDDDERVRLVLERDDSADSVMLVTGVMPIPPDDSGGLAMKLLRWNAERDALCGATIAADSVRREFVLIRDLAFSEDGEAMADEVEAMMHLAAGIREDVGRTRVPVASTAPAASTAALLARAGRSA